jgi:hypothetical protein
MAYNISAFAGAGAQFFDSNGVPLAGGLLYVYTAGTTTPATTWTTSSGAVANTNPIVMNAAGRTPYEIWLNSGVTYKFALYTSTNVLIGTYDNIPAIDDPTAFNNLIAVTGTNTLIGTSVPPYTSYVAGMTLSFIPVNTNTGAVTIDVDGLGAKNIFVGNASALTGSELVAGQIANLEYDGTRFQLFTSVIANDAVTTAKIANNAVTTAKIANNAVTYAKIQNVTAGKVLGRDTSGAGVVQELPILVDTSGNVGLGITPVVNLHGFSSNGGTPATTGTSTTGVSARLQNGSVNFDLGTYVSGACFIQPRLTGNNATNFDLVLNPNGGRVGVNGALVGAVVGTAPLYMARAWVNFNGTGTVAINASGNVSSITDLGVGYYRVNFASSLSDNLYCTIVSAGGVPSGGNGNWAGEHSSTLGGVPSNKSTSLVDIALSTVGGVIDYNSVNVTIFR